MSLFEPASKKLCYNTSIPNQNITGFFKISHKAVKAIKSPALIKRNKEIQRKLLLYLCVISRRDLYFKGPCV